MRPRSRSSGARGHPQRSSVLVEAVLKHVNNHARGAASCWWLHKHEVIVIASGFFAVMRSCRAFGESEVERQRGVKGGTRGPAPPPSAAATGFTRNLEQRRGVARGRRGGFVVAEREKSEIWCLFD